MSATPNWILVRNMSLLCDMLPHGGLTKLARKLRINRNTLSRWLSGRQSPDDDSLNKLAAAFGFTACELTSRELTGRVEGDLREHLVKSISEMGIAGLRNIYLKGVRDGIVPVLQIWEGKDGQ